MASATYHLARLRVERPERMIVSMRPRGVGLVVAGWTILGVAALVLDAGVVLLGVWAWFILARKGKAASTRRAGPERAGDSARTAYLAGSTTSVPAVPFMPLESPSWSA